MLSLSVCSLRILREILRMWRSVCIEQEKFTLRPHIEGISHIGRFLERLLQNIAAVALKGRAVRTVDITHHEKAPSQHEVDFRYDEALATADNIMTFKLAVKTIAKHHGLHGTFMPKPRMEFCGSGMHINMSLHKDGRNIFDDPSDENGLSREAYYFMGGKLFDPAPAGFCLREHVDVIRHFLIGLDLIPDTVKPCHQTCGDGKVGIGGWIRTSQLDFRCSVNFWGIACLSSIVIPSLQRGRSMIPR